MNNYEIVFGNLLKNNMNLKFSNICFGAIMLANQT